jgi:hypothetical protein
VCVSGRVVAVCVSRSGLGAQIPVPNAEKAEKKKKKLAEAYVFVNNTPPGQKKGAPCPRAALVLLCVRSLCGCECVSV